MAEFDELIQKLKDSSWLVRVGTARSLGQLGDPRAVEPLIRALRDRNRDVGAAAATALERLGEGPLAKAVLAILRGHPAELAALQDPRAVDPLLQALGDEDGSVRKAAATTLRQIRDPRAVDPLLQALGNRGSSVRAAAAAALGQLGDPRAVDPLLQALGDGDSDVRVAAATALERLGEGPLAKAVLAILRGHPAELAALQDPRAVDPLLRALGDEDGSVRKAAATTLGQIRDPRAVEPLIRSLGDKDNSVRSAAATALGQLGDPRAAEPLITALKDEEKDVLAAAAEALKSLGSFPTEPILQIMHTAKPVAQRFVVELLGVSQDLTLLPTLRAFAHTCRQARRTELAEAAEKAVEQIAAAHPELEADMLTFGEEERVEEGTLARSGTEEGGRQTARPVRKALLWLSPAGAVILTAVAGLVAWKWVPAVPASVTWGAGHWTALLVLLSATLLAPLLPEPEDKRAKPSLLQWICVTAWALCTLGLFLFWLWGTGSPVWLKVVLSVVGGVLSAVIIQGPDNDREDATSLGCGWLALGSLVTGYWTWHGLTTVVPATWPGWLVVLLKALGTGVAAIGVGFSISAVLVGCYEVSDKRRTTIAESILLAVALLLFQGWRFTLLTLSLTLGPYWLGWAWAYLRWRGATMQTLKPIDLLPVPWRWWGYSIALWWLLAAVVVWGRQWGWLG